MTLFLFEKSDQQKWPALTIQLAIIMVSTGLLLRGVVNAYIVLALVLVLCVFGLQITGVRFLWLYPVWTGDGRSTERTDTLFLKGYLLSSTIALSLGVYDWLISGFLGNSSSSSAHLQWIQALLQTGEVMLMNVMGYLICVLGLLVPILFLTFCNKAIRLRLNREQAVWRRQRERHNQENNPRSE